MASSRFQRPAPNVRISSLGGFLPLSEDIVSTRGQKVPSLIQTKSAANLHIVRARLEQRQTSTYNPVPESDEYQASNNENDIERGPSQESVRSYTAGNSDQQRGKKSTASEILMTPQMRSMRLIGNSNPRYQW